MIHQMWSEFTVNRVKNGYIVRKNDMRNDSCDTWVFGTLDSLYKWMREHMAIERPKRVKP